MKSKSRKMQSKSRKWLLGIAAFFLLLIICFLGLPYVLPYPALARKAEAFLSQQTHSEIKIGSLQVRTFPRLRFSLGDLALKQSPGTPAEQVLKIENILVLVRWLPLFFGKLQVWVDVRQPHLDMKAQPVAENVKEISLENWVTAMQGFEQQIPKRVFLERLAVTEGLVNLFPICSEKAECLPVRVKDLVLIFAQPAASQNRVLETVELGLLFHEKDELKTSVRFQFPQGLGSETELSAQVFFNGDKENRIDIRNKVFPLVNHKRALHVDVEFHVREFPLYYIANSLPVFEKDTPISIEGAIGIHSSFVKAGEHQDFIRVTIPPANQISIAQKGREKIQLKNLMLRGQLFKDKMVVDELFGILNQNYFHVQGTLPVTHHMGHLNVATAFNCLPESPAKGAEACTFVGHFSGKDDSTGIKKAAKTFLPIWLSGQGEFKITQKGIEKLKGMVAATVMPSTMQYELDGAQGQEQLPGPDLQQLEGRFNVDRGNLFIRRADVYTSLGNAFLSGKIFEGDKIDLQGKINYAKVPEQVEGGLKPSPSPPPKASFFKKSQPPPAEPERMIEPMGVPISITGTLSKPVPTIRFISKAVL